MGAGYQQVVGTKRVYGGPLPEYVNVFLTDDGLDSGDINAIGDYSTTSGPDTHFWHSALEEFVVSRLLVHIEDSVGAASADYGNIGSGITNGIAVKVFESDGTTVVHTLSPPQGNVTSNAEWARLCYDMTIANVGSGNDFVNVRWTLAKSGTEVHILPGEHFAVVLHDDLSGLINHNFIIQGYHPATQK